MCRCILYPKSKLFVTSGGKEQSASIVREKVTEICTLVPAFERELDRRPGKTREGKDYVQYVFKNGSYFDNIVANEKSRGKRRHGGLVEECVGVDGEILSSVIIPTMNVSRLCMDGTTQPDETLNKSQIYVKRTISVIIEKSIKENPLNCWEALASKVEGNQQPSLYYKEGSTTISKESTAQAHGKWWAPKG